MVVSELVKMYKNGDISAWRGNVEVFRQLLRRPWLLLIADPLVRQ